MAGSSSGMSLYCVRVGKMAEVNEIELGGARVRLEGTSDYFRERLIHVWGSIPASAGCEISEHSVKPLGHGVVRPVIIRVLDDMTVSSVACQQGKSLEFRSKEAQGDDVYLDRLIAHELAHVHDWAAGKMGRRNPDNPASDVDAEEYAVRIAAFRGYPLPGGISPEEHAENTLKRVQAVQALIF